MGWKGWVEVDAMTAVVPVDDDGDDSDSCILEYERQQPIEEEHGWARGGIGSFERAVAVGGMGHGVEC